MKLLRQHADDLTPLAVDHERSPDDRCIAAEFPAPVTVGQHGGFWQARRIVLFSERTPQSRLDAEKRERAVGYEEG